MQLITLLFVALVAIARGFPAPDESYQSYESYDSYEAYDATVETTVSLLAPHL